MNKSEHGEASAKQLAKGLPKAVQVVVESDAGVGTKVVLGTGLVAAVTLEIGRRVTNEVIVKLRGEEKK